MKLKKIEYSSAFKKNLKRLPRSQFKFLTKRETIFRENLFDPRLKTHKLSGKLIRFYSFSLSYHWRIVFHFADKETIVFDNIGTHEIYK